MKKTFSVLSLLFMVSFLFPVSAAVSAAFRHDQTAIFSQQEPAVKVTVAAVSAEPAVGIRAGSVSQAAGLHCSFAAAVGMPVGASSVLNLSQPAWCFHLTSRAAAILPAISVVQVPEHYGRVSVAPSIPTVVSSDAFVPFSAPPPAALPAAVGLTAAIWFVFRKIKFLSAAAPQNSACMYGLSRQASEMRC